MSYRLVPCLGLLALGFALSACTDNGMPAANVAPPSNATLDTGSHVSGQSGTPLNGGAAVVGTRPSGVLSTTPLPPAPVQ